TLGDLAVVQFERSRVSGSIGQHDRIRGILAERVGTFVEPEEPCDRQPAAIGLQRSFPRLPPSGDLGLEGGHCGQRQRRQQHQQRSHHVDSSSTDAISRSSMAAYSPDRESLRWRSSSTSFSSKRSLSARCRHASTAMRVESALGALAAMESMSASTLAATSSTSRGSPVASSVYGRLRMVTRTGCFSGPLVSMTGRYPPFSSSIWPSSF